MSSPRYDAVDKTTLVALLCSRASLQPDRTAFVFLGGNGEEQATLTYAELHLRARGIAAALQGESFKGQRALLIYPAGLDFVAGFFGCLYAGVVAVPVSMSRTAQGLKKLDSIIEDAAPAALLTTAASAIALTSLNVDPSRLRLLATDTGPFSAAGEWRDPLVKGSDLAFLQYTSGSTSMPKGVMVSHENLRHDSACLSHRFEHSEESVMVTWLPTFHDMGLIYGMLEPLYGGFPCVMMSPQTFLRRPVLWLQAITRYKGTHSASPNFGYELCVRRISEAQKKEISLESWRVALNGAEPVRSSTLQRFRDAFAQTGFRFEAFNPCYGLAEATVMVSGGPASAPPRFCRVSAGALEKGFAVPLASHESGGRMLVSVGTTALDTRVVIADPETNEPLPDEHVGEVWVSGSVVAQGYWKREEETDYTFGAKLAKRGGEAFLRTGDLGVIIDGSLYIVGRIKDLIIIAGRNHYPQDIEDTVEQSHPTIRSGSAIAFSVEADAEEQLVVVAGTVDADARRDPQSEAARQIVDGIRQAVSEDHELRVWKAVLVSPGEVPKTSSGKLQRRLCRDMFLNGAFDMLSGKKLNEAPTDRAQGELNDV